MKWKRMTQSKRYLVCVTKKKIKESTNKKQKTAIKGEVYRAIQSLRGLKENKRKPASARED